MGRRFSVSQKETAKVGKSQPVWKSQCQQELETPRKSPANGDRCIERVRESVGEIWEVPESAQLARGGGSKSPSSREPSHRRDKPAQEPVKPEKIQREPDIASGVQRYLGSLGASELSLASYPEMVLVSGGSEIQSFQTHTFTYTYSYSKP